MALQRPGRRVHMCSCCFWNPKWKALNQPFPCPNFFVALQLLNHGCVFLQFCIWPQARKSTTGMRATRCNVFCAATLRVHTDGRYH